MYDNLILAIDPGICTGWAAVFADNGELQNCGAGDEPPIRVYAPFRTPTVIEKPQIYGAAKSKGDPNDLITLAIQVGQYLERCYDGNMPTGLVLPTTWKGQVPKDIHHKRILAAMTPSEVAFVESKKLPKSKLHNMLDAIGLAKWAYKQKIFGTKEVNDAKK